MNWKVQIFEINDHGLIEVLSWNFPWSTDKNKKRTSARTAGVLGNPSILVVERGNI
jgi:hypothetical protein